MKLKYTVFMVLLLHCNDEVMMENIKIISLKVLRIKSIKFQICIYVRELLANDFLQQRKEQQLFV